MPAKRVRVSDDGGTNYCTLPGNQGELTNEGNEINDTIFGQNFESNLIGLINWQVQANGLYKGFAGYVCDIYKYSGVSTAFTTQPATLVSGKTYQLNNVTQRVWDRTAVFTVFDTAVDRTNQLLSIDFLHGRITFLSSYTVTGAVTITGKYFPSAIIAKGRAFTLTQTMEPIDITDFET